MGAPLSVKIPKKLHVRELHLLGCSCENSKNIVTIGIGMRTHNTCCNSNQSNRDSGDEKPHSWQ